MTDCSAGTGTSALQRSLYDIIGSGRTFRRSRCRRCGSMNAAGYSGRLEVTAEPGAL